MERFANWSELPAKKQEVLERKLFYGKEMRMVHNEVKPHGVLAQPSPCPNDHGAGRRM